MEFKGTKGKWREFQMPNGNMKITSDLWREFAEIQFKHPVNNTEEKREECLYNALLISKAPEILKMLNELLKELEFYGFNNPTTIYNAKQLIREATEL
jgi:hypothetical protein